MVDSKAGPSSSLRFDRTVTELDALQRAVYAVARLMSVEIEATDSHFICSIYPKSERSDVNELEHRLRAEVVDQSLRLRIGRETESVRNLILALAFSQTGLVAEDETIS